MRFIRVILITLIPLGAISQPITPENERDFEIEDFILPGGRLGNNVNDIVQGPNGFMWFATHGGLIRYDGYDFVTYLPDPKDTLEETTSLTFKWLESLYWDSNNLLWISSYGGGIYRFDPKTEIFKHFAYSADNPSGISHPRVLCANEDAYGNLWVGTEKGLNLYDPATETFKHYFSNPDDPKAIYDDDVRNIYIDREGTMWLGTGHGYFAPNRGGLSRYVPETDSFVNYRGLPNGGVRAILEDSNGNFWIGHAEGLFRMNREEGTFEKMIFSDNLPYAPGINERSNPPVYSILEDIKGGLWIGTIMDSNVSSHLLRYDPVTGKSQVYPVKISVWDLSGSRDGTLWVSGAGVSGRVLKITSKVKIYDLSRSIDNDKKLEFLESYRQRMNQNIPDFLIGPFALTMDPETFDIWTSYLIPIMNEQGVNIYSVTPILVQHNTQSNKTDFHLLSELDLNAPSSQGSFKLVIDLDGDVWGTFDNDSIGLFRYNPDSKQLDHFRHDPSDSTSISSNLISDILVDRKGDIWTSNLDGRVNRIKPGLNTFKRYEFNKDEEDINIDVAFSLLEDEGGKIWVGGEMEEYGVYFIPVIDPETHFIEKVLFPDPGSSRAVISITQSPLNYQLIKFAILDGGMGTYSPSTKSLSFTIEDLAFPLQKISSIVADKNGNFWLASAEDGRIVFNTGLMNYLFQEKSGSPFFQNSGYLGPDGNVYFIINNGWVTINPDEINPDFGTSASQVEILDLYIFGAKEQVGGDLLERPLWYTNELYLPYEAESFGIHFSDFDFHNSDPLFQFRLLPYEEDWRSSANTTTANYYKVPPGQYTFQVRSSKKQGLVNDTMNEITITILPPWYRTWWAYLGYAIIFGFGVLGVHTFQKERTIRKERERSKDRELAQAKEVEKAYEELKSTQEQLIHAEKMASLGEMTAGIAHEIQNPLNFVNNFSDVNKELIDELEEEIKNGNHEEAIEILKDLKENEDKIIHHGHRADSIVKSMLQHSRGSSGDKVPTDINAMCDEYVRLAYHGLRAKDKSFNADFKLELDESLPEMNVVPQDIGRVLLNLINNAFQATSSKLKDESRDDVDYKPQVTVTTKTSPLQGGSRGVEVSVKDNGPGIPDEIKDKIFEPFFTTKATGQGTGLGLSMSYDIITKGHGGELKVKSEVGKGSEFLIILPFRS